MTVTEARATHSEALALLGGLREKLDAARKAQAAARVTMGTSFLTTEDPLLDGSGYAVATTKTIALEAAVRQQEEACRIAAEAVAQAEAHERHERLRAIEASLPADAARFWEAFETAALAYGTFAKKMTALTSASDFRPTIDLAGIQAAQREIANLHQRGFRYVSAHLPLPLYPAEKETS